MNRFIAPSLFFSFTQGNPDLFLAVVKFLHHGAREGLLKAGIAETVAGLLTKTPSPLSWTHRQHLLRVLDVYAGFAERASVAPRWSACALTATWDWVLAGKEEWAAGQCCLLRCLASVWCTDVGAGSALMGGALGRAAFQELLLQGTHCRVAHCAMRVVLHAFARLRPAHLAGAVASVLPALMRRLAIDDRCGPWTLCTVVHVVLASPSQTDLERACVAAGRVPLAATVASLLAAVLPGCAAWVHMQDVVVRVDNVVKALRVLLCSMGNKDLQAMRASCPWVVPTLGIMMVVHNGDSVFGSTYSRYMAMSSHGAGAAACGGGAVVAKRVRHSLDSAMGQGRAAICAMQRAMQLACPAALPSPHTKHPWRWIVCLLLGALLGADADADAVCPICLEPLTALPCAALPVCGHKTHAACLLEYFAHHPYDMSKDSCCLCRAPVLQAVFSDHLRQPGTGNVRA